MKRQMTFLSAFALFALPCLGQFQVANTTARRIALKVDVLSTSAPTPSNFTITGPPSQQVLVFLDGVVTPDAAYGYFSPLIAPTPIELALATSFLATLPPSGILTYPIPTPVALVPGTVTDFFVLHVGLDPVSATGISVSQGVRRTASPVVGAPYVAGPTLIGGSFIDVEQGDVDGDGDLDTVLVTCAGGIQVHLFQNGALSVAPNLVILGGNGLPLTAATSCELADLNNDNYLDIVYSGPNAGGYAINSGRAAPAPGSDRLGAWNVLQPGYSQAVPFPLNLGLGPANGNDVETADIDLDGDLDVFVGCGQASTGGEVNRMFVNTTLPGLGVGAIPTFVDQSGVVYSANRADTEDVEFYDMDGDGDYDIVEGNFDGGTATGVDYFAVNGGGIYGPLTTFPGAVNDETLDVVVGDLNLDGAADVYVANWYSTPGALGGPPFGAPVIDRLYLTANGVPFVFTDASNLLPDNPLYQGPTRIQPGASVDAEISDYDLDGDLDIFVPLGRKCFVQAPPTQGFNLLHNNLIELGNPLPSFVLDPRAWLPLPGFSLDYSDIEMGDYQTIFHDQDFGAATFGTGFFSALRN